MKLELIRIGQKVRMTDGTTGTVQHVYTKERSGYVQELGLVTVNGINVGCQHIVEILEEPSILQECDNLASAVENYRKTEEESNVIWSEFVKKNPCYS